MFCLDTICIKAVTKTAFCSEIQEYEGQATIKQHSWGKCTSQVDGYLSRYWPLPPHSAKNLAGPGKQEPLGRLGKGILWPTADNK